MYTDNELFFPRHVIPTLRDLRGDVWRELVDDVAAREETHERVLAFMLMMVRLNGCMACETDSYRAMRGCTMCAHQTLRRFKGQDGDLLKLFDEALVDIRAFADDNPNVSIVFAKA